MLNINRIFENALGHPRGAFNVQLRCYSVAMCEGIGSSKRIEEIDNGGKILLPPSCLDWLTRLDVTYPMMFKLVNPDPAVSRATHAGVIEFQAAEGQCHLPAWMMRQLCLQEGSRITITSATLPVATYAKFKPADPDFFQLSNPKAMLEVQLRQFACLTKGDVIAFNYIGRVFELAVVDVKPGNAVSVIECDVNVEFETPEGYEEPCGSGSAKSGAGGSATSPDGSSASGSAPVAIPGVEEIPEEELKDLRTPGSFKAFIGEGNRLDGKGMTKDQEQRKASTHARVIGKYLLV